MRKKPVIDPILRKLAERVARVLFTNGSAERAQRLVLVNDRPCYRDLGGWAEVAAVDRIYRVLVEARDNEPTDPPDGVRGTAIDG